MLGWKIDLLDRFFGDDFDEHAAFICAGIFQYSFDHRLVAALDAFSDQRARNTENYAVFVDDDSVHVAEGGEPHCLGDLCSKG